MSSLREYYETKTGTPAEFFHFQDELAFPPDDFFEECHMKRVESLQDAKNNPIGPPMIGKDIFSERKQNYAHSKNCTPTFTKFYSDGDVEIGSFKPGKEAASDYSMTSYHKDKRRVKNPHDMFPVILNENLNIAAKITFDKKTGQKVSFYTPWTLPHISEIFDNVLKRPNGAFALELIGCLMIRMAYMLDHHQDENKNWRLLLPPWTLKKIKSIVPYLEFNQGDLPQKFSIESFLYWFDVLAINEDIKVDAKGLTGLLENNKITNKGRTNTLLTYSYCIGAMLGRLSVGNFVFNYNRNYGIYPLEHELIATTFPMLDRLFMGQHGYKSHSEIGWFFNL